MIFHTKQDITLDGENFVYRSTAQTPPGTNPSVGAFWTSISKDQYIGPSFQYSPWTKEKANLYLNYSMCPNRPYDVDFSAPAFVDSNLIIRDAVTWQDECIMIINRINDIPNQYLLSYY